MQRLYDRQIRVDLRLTITDIRWFPAGLSSSYPYHVVLWRTKPATIFQKLLRRGRGEALEPLWEQRFITYWQAQAHAGWIIVDPDRFMMEGVL